MYAGVQAAQSKRDGSPGRAAVARCRLLFVQPAHFASGSTVQALHHGHLHRQRPPRSVCDDGFAIVTVFFFFVLFREFFKMKLFTFFFPFYL